MAGLVQKGMKIALPVDYAGVSMAMTSALIESGVGELHIICVPTGGLQVDQLVGAGLVATVETSAVSLGEAGGAPRFNQAVKDGSIRVLDATCPAIHAGLMAAQKGAPFMPMRGLIGSDILRFRPDWPVISNPLSEQDDPVVLIPALTPDIAIFHAPMADRFGNVWIGRRRELAAMAYASRQTLVTVERITDENLLASEMTAAGTLPAIYVDAIALSPGGARPYGLWGEYAPDAAEIRRYASAAKTQEGFAEYMSGQRAEIA
ncbi:MAG TPA: CoA-transferase [Mesorhizobium sp.]